MNFGIAVAFELRVHKPPDEDDVSGADPLPHRVSARGCMAFYNEWIETVPDELAVYGYMGEGGRFQRIRTPASTPIGLTPIFNGEHRGEGMDLIAPILKFPKHLYQPSTT